MTYRILSIDGGGVYGAVSISLIDRIVKQYPDFLEKTDLIAGTSVGGILGLFLANGETPSHIKDAFYDSVKLIFKRSPRRTTKAYVGLQAFFSHVGLLAVLNRKLGDVTLANLKKKVVVPAFQLYSDDPNHHWKAKIFHNFEGEDSDGREKAAAVAAATSSAPIIFPTYDVYIDGALVENNPAMCALAQTQDERCLIDPRPKLSDLKMLSIGREKAKLFTSGKDLDWGYIYWAKKMVDLIMDRDDRVVDYQVKRLLGNNYHRISVLDGLCASVDDVEVTPKLLKLGEEWDLNDALKWVGANW